MTTQTAEQVKQPYRTPAFLVDLCVKCDCIVDRDDISGEMWCMECEEVVEVYNKTEDEAMKISQVCCVCNSTFLGPKNNLGSNICNECDTSDKCPSCGDRSVTRSIVKDSFEYGTHHNPVMLYTIIPVYTCSSCDFEFTEDIASEIRAFVVKEYIETCRTTKTITELEAEIVTLRKALSRCASLWNITTVGECGDAYNQAVAALATTDHKGKTASKAQPVKQEELPTIDDIHAANISITASPA